VGKVGGRGLDAGKRTLPCPGKERKDAKRDRAGVKSSQSSCEQLSEKKAATKKTNEEY